MAYSSWQVRMPSYVPSAHATHRYALLSLPLMPTHTDLYTESLDAADYAEWLLSLFRRLATYNGGDRAAACLRWPTLELHALHTRSG